MNGLGWYRAVLCSNSRVITAHSLPDIPGIRMGLEFIYYPARMHKGQSNRFVRLSVSLSVSTEIVRSGNLGNIMKYKYHKRCEISNKLASFTLKALDVGHEC